MRSVNVVAPFVVNCLVVEPVTVTVPAVPLLIYPALTVGVTLLFALAVAVINPLFDTVIVGFAVTVVAGIVADPFATAFVLCANDFCVVGICVEGTSTEGVVFSVIEALETTSTGICCTC